MRLSRLFTGVKTLGKRPSTRWLLLLYLTQGLAPNASSEQRLLPVIIAISGTGAPKIVLQNKEKDAIIGSTVEFGSTIRTGATHAVSLTYPDQSIVTIDKNSRYIVVEKRGDSQINQLDYGQVHGVIETNSKSVAEKTGTPPRPPKFLIRSKTVTMGVRGTEFLMGVDPFGLKAKIFTLNGTVDVATSETNLISGKVTPLKSGKFISSSEKGLQAPEAFQRKDIEKLLKQGESLYPPAASPPSGTGAAAGGAPGFGPPGGTPGVGGGGVGLGLPGGTSGVGRINPDGTSQNPELDQRVDPTKPMGNQGLDPNASNTPIREKDKEVQNFRLLSFQAGIFYAQTLEDEITRALFLSWSPTLKLPILNCLYIRGNFGIVFAKNGSLANKFIGQEYQVFAMASLFDTLFAELGGGEQIWPRLRKDGGVIGMNAGVFTGKDKVLQRIWFGISSLPGTRTKANSGPQLPGSNPKTSQEQGAKPVIKLGVGFIF